MFSGGQKFDFWKSDESECMKAMLYKSFLLLMLALFAMEARAVNIAYWTTKHGMRVALVENHDHPLVDLRMDFDAGMRRDFPEKLGVAAMTLELLDAGSAQYSEEKIAETVSDFALQLSASIDEDRAAVRLRSLAEPQILAQGVTLLQQILGAPSFPAKILAREQKHTIESMKQAKMRPDYLASQAMTRAIYGDHPYAFAARTSEEDVAALQVKDLRQFWQQHYQAKAAYLSLVGAISRQQAEQLADQLAAVLPVSDFDFPKISAPSTKPSQALIREQLWFPHHASQSSVMLGKAVLTRHDPDYYPLLVGNYILGGGGFDSRLMQVLRDQSGLTYGASSSMAPNDTAGEFVLHALTRQQASAQALQLMREVLDNFVKNGVSEAELQQAKNNIAGSFPLRLDSNRKLLDHVAVMLFYDLPKDFLTTYPAKVRAVTREQVRDAFARRAASDYVQVVVGGAENPTP